MSVDYSAVYFCLFVINAVYELAHQTIRQCCCYDNGMLAPWCNSTSIKYSSGSVSQYYYQQMMTAISDSTVFLGKIMNSRHRF